jgi:hypothetical protein
MFLDNGALTCYYPLASRDVRRKAESATGKEKPRCSERKLDVQAVSLNRISNTERLFCTLMLNRRFVLRLVVRQAMRSLIQQIVIPAKSPVGYGPGIDCIEGQSVSVCGRPLAQLQTAQNLKPDALVIALIEDWQVIRGGV